MKTEIISMVVVGAVVIASAIGCSRRNDPSRGSSSLALEPNKPFSWHKGTTLTATGRATLVLPGAILLDGTPFGQVIVASDDDMEIGFSPKSDGPGFDTVILKFKKGQSVTLTRSCEAILVDEQNKPKVFLKQGQ